jgi:hypothetical protein
MTDMQLSIGSVITFNFFSFLNIGRFQIVRVYSGFALVELLLVSGIFRLFGKLMNVVKNLG